MSDFWTVRNSKGYSAVMWSTFVHQFYRQSLKSVGEATSDRKILLMLSGGVDSVLLLETLFELKSVLRFSIEVLHCHHGGSENVEQAKFRDHAAEFCRELCDSKRLIYHEERSPHGLTSEQDCRQWRLDSISRVESKRGVFNFVVLAHHKDDFLETQLMRLIRGSGAEGALQPFFELSGHKWRPFFHFSRQEILSAAREKDLCWLEDPSNQNPQFMRNWIRHVWLPQLEERAPGSLSSFARSLELLTERSESMQDVWPPGLWCSEGLSRPHFLALSPELKSRCIAEFLRTEGVRDFTQGQIKEILKNLDISQNEHTFKVARLNWVLSRLVIRVLKHVEGHV